MMDITHVPIQNILVKIIDLHIENIIIMRGRIYDGANKNGKRG